LESRALEARRAFGFLFICVSIAVAAGALLSEAAYLNQASANYYVLIWLGSFAVVFGMAFPKFRKIAGIIKARMKTSATWSTGSKVLNALSWAGPFLAIPFFPVLYQYLILLGIGLGNLSTYFLIKKYSGNDNREQVIVASVSLGALPVALAIDTLLFMDSQDIAILLSRLLIAASYAAGGVYAVFSQR
jgi:hypothetical protein